MGTAGRNITSLLLWSGKTAEKRNEGIRKRIGELTNHFKVQPVEMEQGEESDSLLQIMGGRLDVRRVSWHFSLSVPLDAN